MADHPGRDFEEQVRDALREGLPGLPLRSVALIGEGEDNLAYEVNGELIVRFGKEPDPVRRAQLVGDEAGLLGAVAKISPLPVPEPVFTDLERGCWAYPKLPGVQLLDVAPAERLTHGPVVAAELGAFLAALHAAPVERMARFAGPDEVPPAEWRDEAAETYPAVMSEIPAVRRKSVEAFLAAPPPDACGALVFSHNDLGIEHVLIDPATAAITGIIDWSDAALVDPAYDFGLIHRDLGPAALAAALSGYLTGDHAALRERAIFYARCALLEDLAYGVQTGLDAYTEKSLTALEWSF